MICLALSLCISPPQVMHHQIQRAELLPYINFRVTSSNFPETRGLNENKDCATRHVPSVIDRFSTGTVISPRLKPIVKCLFYSDRTSRSDVTSEKFKSFGTIWHEPRATNRLMTGTIVVPSFRLLRMVPRRPRSDQPFGLSRK